jgi:hypothetical protein
MRKLGRIKAEGIIQHYLFRGIADVVVASYDMRYSGKRVVYDYGKIIGWNTVFTDKNKIVYFIVSYAYMLVSY